MNTAPPRWYDKSAVKNSLQLMINDLLFSLVRGALWGHDSERNVVVDSHALKDIIDMAKRQSVMGLVADGILNRNVEGMNRDIKMKLFSYQLGVEKNNRMINRELAEFAAMLRQNGIKFFVVKGQTVGCLYRNPMLRSPGDIDIYCANRDIEKIKGLIRDLGCGTTEGSSFQHFEFERHGVEFEIHYILAGFNTKGHQRYWNDIIEREVTENLHSVKIDGTEIPTLSPTLNAAFVFIHLYHHFLKEGVGLRQLCDWAMVLNHYQEDIDRVLLTEVLSRLGHLKAYRALGCILTDHLGLPAEVFPYSISKNDRRYGERILKEVMRGGNFGWYGRWTRKGGWLHSLETGSISVRHCIGYWRLSPKENLMFLPLQAGRSLKKNFMGKDNGVRGLLGVRG